MVWRALSLCVLSILVSMSPCRSQDTPDLSQDTDQFFSGIVTDLTSDRISVERTVLGQGSDSHTFMITPETRVEGKLRLRARVTVRYVSSEDGDRAVHIIVRPHKSNVEQGSTFKFQPPSRYSTNL